MKRLRRVKILATLGPASQETAVLKRLLAPLSRKRIQREKAYFAGPSGE